MKNTINSKVLEKVAARILFEHLLQNNIEKYETLNMFNNIKKEFYTYDDFKKSDEADKYYQFIFAHAEKTLKKVGYINYSIKSDREVDIPAPTLNAQLSDGKYEWNTESTMVSFFDLQQQKKLFIPNIQRPSAWHKAKDYTKLAESIFQGMPMGIMYFWEVSREEIESITHYKFKQNVTKEKATKFDPAGMVHMSTDEVYSVIDGQQRITAMNVLIKGEHEGKVACFNEKKSELSKMFKFHNIDKGMPFGWTELSSIYSKLEYVYNRELNDVKAGSKKEDIKTANNNMIKDISSELYISTESLEKFYYGFFNAKNIAICKIKDATITQMMDVFIRVNEGGKPLKPVDLMLTYLTGNNPKIKVRKYINDYLKSFKTLKENASYETIMKLIALFFSGNPKSTHEDLNKILKFKSDKEWQILGKAIEMSMKLIKDNNFDGKDIRSTNSLIPIIVWHAKVHGRKTVVDQSVIDRIMIYLRLAQSFKEFSSGTDDKLKKLWKILEDNSAFENVKLHQEITKEQIVKYLADMNYERNRKELLNILKFTKVCMNKTDDSVEHLDSQKANGSHMIYNLAALPRGINSEIGAKSIKDKIEWLSNRYNEDEEEISSRLLLNYSDDERVSIIADRLIPLFK